MTAQPQRLEATAPAEFFEVGAARALPAFCYTDAAVLEIERQELFLRSWHYVCHRGRLDEPGKYVTTTLFDQDILVVCDTAGELRAFYNVCAHRGHRLLEGSGKKHRLVCPYHAWSYGLDGRLQGLRSSGREQAFSADEICLSPVRVERLLDFVFINLDPDATALADQARGLTESIRTAVPDLDAYRPRAGGDYFGGAYACNWKVAIDNFLECYHCEVAHPSFADMMNIPGSRFTVHESFVHQYIPSAGKADNAAFPLDLERDDLDGHFWFLFPNTTFSIFPGTKNFSVSRIEADGVERSRRVFDTFAPAGISAEREAARAQWGLQVVNAEDRALCESVQRGMHQKGFSQGYYLVDPGNHNLTEEVVRYFHRRYADSLGATIAAARERRP